MKMSSSFTSAAYIIVHSKLDFIMEADTMNPDQTAPWEQSDLGTYCLQCKLHKDHKTFKEQKSGKGLIWNEKK